MRHSVTLQHDQPSAPCRPREPARLRRVGAGDLARLHVVDAVVVVAIPAPRPEVPVHSRVLCDLGRARAGVLDHAGDVPLIGRRHAEANDAIDDRHDRVASCPLTCDGGQRDGQVSVQYPLITVGTGS